MPAERTPMRLIREMLRQKYGLGASDRAIARSVGVARSTVAGCLARAAAADVGWPLPAGLCDADLERRLFARGSAALGRRRKAEPDFAQVHRELRRKGVTLMLLWQEYRQGHPKGYGYSRWCELYRAFEARLAPTMRQAHPAGERLFVDYAGQTMEVVDPHTGEIAAAQVFVAVMGASSFTWAEATATQTLPDWIGSHVRALDFFGGVPAQIVPDNPKVAVVRADWREPGLNRTYQELADHYGTAILPARPRKPRDKAKVEAGVLVVERFVLAALRNRRFFSLAELNAAIRERLEMLNGRPMKRLLASRAELFERLDRPALKALPAEPFAYAEWRIRRVGLDYHVDVDGHYYSVPHRLLKRQVEARVAARSVELFHKGERVAVHLRGGARGAHTTLPEHMPAAHRRHAEWTIDRLKREAAAVGPATGALVAAILSAKPHPEQGFRASLGILRLARHFGKARLEAACERGLGIGARTFGSIRSILDNGLDRAFAAPIQIRPPLDHANIRGPDYYQGDPSC